MEENIQRIEKLLDGLAATTLKGFEDVNHRLDAMDQRLDRIENILVANHDRRLDRLEDFALQARKALGIS